MPAESEAQRKLACVALSMKRGKTERSYSKKAADMAASMSEAELEKYCGSKVAGAPKKKHPFIRR